jgi:sporulation protein YlmC with PRC-barrel domain
MKIAEYFVKRVRNPFESLSKTGCSGAGLRLCRARAGPHCFDSGLADSSVHPWQLARRSIIMKRFLTGTIWGCLALVAFSLSPSCLRGDEPRRKVDVDVDRGGVQVDVGDRQVTVGDKMSSNRTTNVVRIKDLLNLKVYGGNDEKLGDIEDIVIDPAQGKIRYAVLSFGGFLGMGDKLFAVPWSDIQFVSKGVTKGGTQKEDHCYLAIHKEDLKNAPGFDKNNWPNFADNNWSVNIDKYYNEHRHTRKPSGTLR